jgi:hypothetical protein
VNDAPVFTSVVPATATEDVPYLYAASADDADGAGQAWSLLPAHTCGGTVNAAGLFSFTPAGPVPPPSCVVALQVCDGGAPNACAQQVATVTVTAVNDLPSFTPPANITRAATSADGVAVSWVANGSDPEDGPLPASCTPASGSVFAVGDTTVSCAVTDTNGATAGGTFTVTVTNLPVPGDMKGDGFVRGDDARYQFTFHARENAAGNERARLSVRVDEHGRNKGKKRDDRFESRSVDFMSFSDDPAVTAGRTPVDTVLFKGAGEWNGAGGPGRHRESVRVVITKGADVVASFDGELDGGNIQSRRIRH